jgi:hypothetical protein
LKREGLPATWFVGERGRSWEKASRRERSKAKAWEKVTVWAGVREKDLRRVMEEGWES